jgi:hypothetical protein
VEVGLTLVDYRDREIGGNFGDHLALVVRNLDATPPVEFLSIPLL